MTLAGSIGATRWPNETEHGIRCAVMFSRVSGDGDTWKSTDSFERDDLLHLAEGADRVHSRIVNK